MLWGVLDASPCSCAVTHNDVMQEPLSSRNQPHEKTCDTIRPYLPMRWWIETHKSYQRGWPCVRGGKKKLANT